MITKPGIYENIPFAEYTAIEAASNSRLTELRRSPAHLKAYMEEPRKATTALLVGRASHTSILEPLHFDTTFCVASQCEEIKKSDSLQCSNSGIAYDARAGWYCGQHKKGKTSDESRVIVSPAEWLVCQGVRESVHAHPAASALLSDEFQYGSVELTVLWNDSDTGLLCKARFDRWSPHFGTIADIKTALDAGKSQFGRAIFTRGYHRQGAFYLEGARAAGIPAEHFVNIAAEKESPYAVACYRLMDSAVQAGSAQLRPLLRRYADCVATNRWPAYSDIVEDISLPDYAWRQIDEEIMEAVA